MIPDVTGYTLDEAVSLLEAAGVSGIEITLTAPPREKNRQHNSNSRVVRQLASGGAGEGTSVELVVCNIDLTATSRSGSNTGLFMQPYSL